MFLEKVRSCLSILEPGFWTYACLDTSSWPKLPKCSLEAPPGCKVSKFSDISKFYWIHLIFLEKVRSCLSILEPGFWTYACLDTSSWPKLPKFSLQAPGPNKVNKFSNISKFYWIHLTILEKVWFANIRARGSGLVWIPLLDRASC